MKFCNL